MNRKLFFFMAVFVALVGIAMMTADTEAGHRRGNNCCNTCYSSCYSYSCHSCYGGCYGSCYGGCHGGYYHGCHGSYYGCSGCHGYGHVHYGHGYAVSTPVHVQTATVATTQSTTPAKPVASRAQFGFRTAQFVR